MGSESQLEGTDSQREGSEGQSKCLSVRLEGSEEV